MLNSVCFSVSHGPLFKGPSLFSSTFFQGKSPSVSFNLWLLRDCISTPEMNFWSYKQKQDMQEKLAAVLSLSPPVTSHHPYWQDSLYTQFWLFQLNSEGFVFLYFIRSWLCYGRGFSLTGDRQSVISEQLKSYWEKQKHPFRSLLNSLNLNLQKAFLALTFIKPFQSRS